MPLADHDEAKATWDGGRASWEPEPTPGLPEPAMAWGVYCRAMGPAWQQTVRAILGRRAYEVGLVGVCRLLAATDRHKDRLGVRAWTENRKRLYGFSLALLDRADRWREFLETWERLRGESGLTVTYSARGLEVQWRDIEPYVVAGRESGEGEVHFLFGLAHRREVILRKVCRRSRADWHRQAEVVVQ